jgi:hypothetical protein
MGVAWLLGGKRGFSLRRRILAVGVWARRGVGFQGEIGWKLGWRADGAFWEFFDGFSSK